MFRNFGNLFYVVLPVAALLAVFANPRNEVTYWQMLCSGQFTSYDVLIPAAIRAFTVMRYARTWWTAILSVFTLLLLALTVSMLIVKINRHMHVGEMSALPFKRAFRLFPVTLLALACYFALTEIAMLLSVGIMYILRGISNTLVVALVGVAVNAVLRTLSAWVFMLLLLSLPLKYSENYHLNVAMSYSVRVMSKQTKVVVVSVLVYLLGRCAFMAVGYFAQPYNLDIVLYGVGYLLSVMFLPCLAYCLYHDVVGGERRDITQIMFD